jgi:hypothetical protein
MATQKIREFDKSKKRFFGKIGGFIAGVLIGYVSGYMRVHESFFKLLRIEKLLSLWSWLTISFSAIRESFFLNINYKLNWLLDFTPNIDFASDIIAYQAAVIAIAIPLSFEIVSRISERYKSGVITREFNRQWQFISLLFLVLIDACLGVFLKFFIKDQITGYWKLSAWLILILFLITNIILLAFFNNLRKYATQTDFLLKQLSEDLNSALNQLKIDSSFREKKIHLLQKKLINALEGIGDILVFETSQRKSEEYITDALRQIQESGKSLFELQESNPKRLERILYEKDFLQLQKTNEMEASLHLAFFPKRNSVLITTITNQFLRVHKTALEFDNLEVARLATYNVIWFLEYLSQLKNNEKSVNILLGVIGDLRSLHQKEQSHFSFTLNITWYISVVFEKEFNIDYLWKFNREFTSCARKVIAKGQDEIFKHIVESLYQSNSIGGYGFYAFDTLESSLMYLNPETYMRLVSEHDIGRKIRSLKHSGNKVKTLDQLEDCIQLLDEIQELVILSFESSNRQKIDQEFFKVRDNLKSRLKFNILIGVVFGIGAYCVFKGRFDYIQLLWTFRQPDDADANWVSHDIVPTSLPEIFNLYFGEHASQHDFPFYWEDHHGSRRYYSLYFLILVLREFIRPNICNNEEYQSLIDRFKIPKDLNSYDLSNVISSSEYLISLVGDLVDQENSLRLLGFSDEYVNQAIEEGLSPFLESLIAKAKYQIDELKRSTNISFNKFSSFCESFMSGYKEVISVKSLFRYFGFYFEDKSDESDHTQIPYFGRHEINEKSIFFDNWYVDSSHLGNAFGNGFARSESSYLLIQIMKACEKLDTDSVDEVIHKFEETEIDSLIIIHVNYAPYNLLENSEQFCWKQEGDIQIPGFIGSYLHGNHRIPVFRYYYKGYEGENVDIPGKAVLVIDKRTFPVLTQYHLGKLEIQHCLFIEYFRFQVQEFSGNDELIEEYLQRAPDWLVDKGDQPSQRRYLEERAIMKIDEKINLEFKNSFCGFILSMQDN